MAQIHIPPILPPQLDHQDRGLAREMQNYHQRVVVALQRIVEQINSSDFGLSDITRNLNMSNFRITNLGNPTNGRDAVNRDYLDTEIGRINIAIGQSIGGGLGPGSAPGNDTEIIYNDNGNFGAEPAFTYDRAGNIMYIEGTTTSRYVHMDAQQLNWFVDVSTTTVPSYISRINIQYGGPSGGGSLYTNGNDGSIRNHVGTHGYFTIGTITLTESGQLCNIESDLLTMGTSNYFQFTHSIAKFVDAAAATRVSISYGGPSGGGLIQTMNNAGTVVNSAGTDGYFTTQAYTAGTSQLFQATPGVARLYASGSVVRVDLQYGGPSGGGIVDTNDNSGTLVNRLGTAGMYTTGTYTANTNGVGLLVGTSSFAQYSAGSVVLKDASSNTRVQISNGGVSGAGSVLTADSTGVTQCVLSSNGLVTTLPLLTTNSYYQCTYGSAALLIGGTIAVATLEPSRLYIENTGARVEVIGSFGGGGCAMFVTGGSGVYSVDGTSGISGTATGTYTFDGVAKTELRFKRGLLVAVA